MMADTGVRSALTDNRSSVELILNEIPFFAVGVLAFGVMTFLLAIRRVNLHSFYLYGSILLAFSGGILDLGQVLSRGPANVDHGLGVDSVKTIISIREVAFALSIGLRLLFYWILVALCPSRESPAQSTGDKTDHSASWSRWGSQGAILKWMTFISIVVVAILQVVWRIEPFPSYNTVYLADTALGIVVSSIFILKLLLNTYLSPRSSLQLRSYAAPIVALIFNISVGVGNAAYFGFSETTLGRFLQAVELYILVEYLLISTFYRSSRTRSSSPHDHDQEVGFLPPLSNPEKQFDKEVPPIPPPPVPKKSPPLPRKQLPEGEKQPGQHSHAGSRLSSWITLRRNSRRPLSGGEQLWQPGKAELGAPDGGYSAGLRQETPDLISPLVQETMVYAQSALSSQATIVRPPLALEGPHSVVEEVPRSHPVPVVISRPEAHNSVAIPSYYGLNSRTPSPIIPPRPLPTIRKGADSPVYGLEKTLYLSNRSSIANEEFIRQQSDLDKSIAALRQFSSDELETQALKPGSKSTLGSKHTSASESTFKPESAAASEFSLSHFPEPPEESVMLMPAPRSRPSTIRSTRTVRSIRQRDASPQPPPPPIAVPPIPRKEDVSTPERDIAMSSFNSAATQFDVTSFIGGLMPPPGIPHSGGAPGSSRLDSVAPTVEEQYLRDTERRSVLRSLRQSAVASTTPSNNTLSAVSSQSLGSAPFHARNGLPPRPRVGITGPRPSLQDSTRSPPISRPPLPKPRTVEMP